MLPPRSHKNLERKYVSANWKWDIIRKTGNDYCKMTQEAFFQQNIAHEGSCGNCHFYDVAITQKTPGVTNDFIITSSRCIQMPTNIGYIRKYIRY